MIIINKLVCRS